MTFLLFTVNLCCKQPLRVFCCSVAEMTSKTEGTCEKKTNNDATTQSTQILDDKLKQELLDTATNQINFFISINQWNSQLLLNDQYTHNEAM